jgi:hypothetical protein
VAIKPVRFKNRDLELHKAVIAPQFGVPTVLSNTPWEFVSLWLKRKHKTDALFYWDQARQFQKAAIGLPPQSAPLLLYYCFMNAAKALLSSKGIVFNPYHGLKGTKIQPGVNRFTLANEGVKILAAGVLPSLSDYYGDTETSKLHSLKELFLNLAYIHRTYCLTYRSQQEIFAPLRECKYVYDTNTKQVFAQGMFVKANLRRHVRPSIPNTMHWIQEGDDIGVRSVRSLSWQRPGKPSETNLAALPSLHSEVRFNFHYINGVRTLWYLKLSPSQPLIKRRQPVITLAAMHRLSEICRYHPLKLASLLEGDQNWLLTEFINMSPAQFLDEMCSEITGHQFLVPNVRTP